MALENFVTKLEKSLENLITLKITTYVGAVPADPAGPRDKDAKIIRTKVDMLMGDISTEIDPAFVTGEYVSLREFHAGREARGAEIIRTNVEVMKHLFTLLLDAKKG